MAGLFNMRLFILACLALVCYSEDINRSDALVQVYSHHPGQFGEKNVLICYVSGFHPPDITIQLMNGKEEMPNANQTDLAFKPDWHFHLTRSVVFMPQRGEQYFCKVTHGKVAKSYNWEPNM